MASVSELPEIVYRSLYTEKEAHHKELYLDLTIRLSCGMKLIIPKGFRTDLATVPRLFWGIISPSGRHDLAVIVHDYLLEHNWSRKAADKELLYLLKLSSVHWLKRGLIFIAVTIYGLTK